MEYLSIITKTLCSLGLIAVAWKHGDYLAKTDHLITLIISTAIAITIIYGEEIIKITTN